MSDPHEIHAGLPVIAFETRDALRGWLIDSHDSSPGVWVRLAKAGSGIRSVTFHDLLEEGLCFGWSESTRHAGDTATYLQRFTPRHTRGTTSARNLRLVAELRAAGLMTPAGEAVL
ncbi:MAG: hypothetical protein U0Q21_14155 [Dermatophilaceae bacterium]